jgi:hypothetical protein
MDVNKIKILQSIGNKEIVVPLSVDWDFSNRENDLIREQNNIVDNVINKPTNYELQRFSYKPDINGLTKLIYNFFFKSNLNAIPTKSYLTKFTNEEIFFRSNPFKKSFFKLDLYDKLDPTSQKIYLSIVLTADRGKPLVKTCTSYYIFPQDITDLNSTIQYTDCCGISVTQNFVTGINFCAANGNTGIFTNGSGVTIEFNFTENPTTSYTNFIVILDSLQCSCDSGVDYTTDLERLIIPEIELDFIGNQESYFIYWFENKDTVSIDKLYMSAKFFDAGEGGYTKFSRVDQNSFGKPFNLPNEYFYYELNFDYLNSEYYIVEPGLTNVIYEPTWIEYVNPPIS